MTQPINVHVHLGDDVTKLKGRKGDEEETPKEGEEETEEKMEVSELASLGRVHLMIEQAMKIDGLPEEATNLLGQALGELEAAMNGEESEEEEADDEPEETNEEETDEEKEGEDDEDGKEPHQYVMEDEDAEEEKEGEEDEEDDEEAKADDDVTPDDSEGRADEDEEKGYDVASDLFASALAKHRKAPKTAPKKGKTPPAKTGGKAKK